LMEVLIVVSLHCRRSYCIPEAEAVGAKHLARA
jgi:hypothetical protein